MDPAEKPSLRQAALASAGLSVFFLAIYGTTNALASLRTAVPSLNFAWESRIPVIPLFILPYLSSDLFFTAAPFVARSHRELAVIVKRLAFATLIAGIIFLLFPQKFAYPRPEFPGFLGLGFSIFHSMDPPFNEFPSLHIAFCLILGDLYLRHTRGILRALTAIWFILLFLSPIFTWQHHLLDIAGGFVLGALCIHFFDIEPLRQPTTGNRRVRNHYLVGAAAFALLSVAWGPWTWLLLWPAFSLLLAALGYAYIGPGIYRKKHGRLTWTTWFFLWPLLLGQRFSLIHYARRAGRWDRLTDQVWIGSRLNPSDARDLHAQGITAILDLTCEFSEAAALRQLAYMQLPILDLTAPTPTQAADAIAFIQHHAADGIVYVHCKLGFSRTAAIAGAYLLATGAAVTPDEAAAMLARARPGIIIRPEARHAIEHFAARPVPLTANA
ncbi:MAG TPA: dual specificity protein phosphatase family protein [Phycisphaerae bacterium]|nr:dual specificity protein phosphatase family protein [Phycisphaerae bacterium]